VKKKENLSLITKDGSEVQVNVEVANTFIKKAKGLMFRKSLGQNEGMLFVFDKPYRPSFWMLFTYIKLEAIFFSDDGNIVDILPMNPGLRPLFYKPKADAKYVLEVNQGFCIRNSVDPSVKQPILTFTNSLFDK